MLVHFGHTRIVPFLPQKCQGINSNLVREIKHYPLRLTGRITYQIVKVSNNLNKIKFYLSNPQ